MRLVSLAATLTLPMHAQSVFITEDCNCVKGQLVGCSEDTNGDFASVGHQNLLQLHDGAVGTDVVYRLGLLRRHALLEDILLDGGFSAGGFQVLEVRDFRHLVFQRRDLDEAGGKRANNLREEEEVRRQSPSSRVECREQTTETDRQTDPSKRAESRKEIDRIEE